jgi:hypothetical protein
MFGWFAALILVPCIIIGNFFLAIILILMVPIFLLAAFAAVHFEKLTGSVIPVALILSVVLTLLIVTLSPVGFNTSFGLVR